MERSTVRAGVVDLFSFVDMESAESFLRSRAAAGLDLRRVLLYWADPISIDFEADPSPASTEPSPYSSGREQQPAAAIDSQWSIAAPVIEEPTVSPIARPGREDRLQRQPQKQAEAPAIRPPSAQPAAKPRADQQKGDSQLRRLRTWPGWNGLGRRLVLAATFKESVYEELPKDPYARRQVAVVVGLAALAAGIGAIGSGPVAMIVYMLASPLGWVVYVRVTYLVATSLFKVRPAGKDLPDLFVALGFASSPRLLFLLAAFPTYGPLFVLLVLIWVAVPTAIASKHTLDVDEPTAAISAMASGLALFAVSVVAASLLTRMIA